MHPIEDNAKGAVKFELIPKKKDHPRYMEYLCEILQRYELPHFQ